MYRLATKAYLADGRDGYAMLKDCPILVGLRHTFVYYLQQCFVCSVITLNRVVNANLRQTVDAR